MRQFSPTGLTKPECDQYVDSLPQVSTEDTLCECAAVAFETIRCHIPRVVCARVFARVQVCEHMRLQASAKGCPSDSPLMCSHRGSGCLDEAMRRTTAAPVLAGLTPTGSCNKLHRVLFMLLLLTIRLAIPSPHMAGPSPRAELGLPSRTGLCVASALPRPMHGLCRSLLSLSSLLSKPLKC